VVHLPQFIVTVTQHAEVELVVFCRFTDKCTFLDCGNEKRDGVPVIQLVDEITLGPTGKDDCLTVALRKKPWEEGGNQSETYAVTLSGGVIARKPG